MAKRRDWNALSNAYRSRLTRNGITKAAYESGADLSAARGHANTPEHPEDAIHNQSKYQKYRANLKRLQNEAWEKKKRIFEGNHKWHEGRARAWIYGGPQNPKMPGARMLRAFINMPDEDVYEKASEAGYHLDDDWQFLFYH
jgi:hypothetical protein